MSLSIRISGVICVALAACMTVYGQTPTQVTVIKSQHERLTVPSDIQRIAVGDPDILSAEAINNRELLLLGKNSGRTTLLIWSRDGRGISCSNALAVKRIPGVQ
jgi:Flp pilus assembly secretin CpaC